jgi:hypothetical protein
VAKSREQQFGVSHELSAVHLSASKPKKQQVTTAPSRFRCSATYESGWRWSIRLSRALGEKSCDPKQPGRYLEMGHRCHPRWPGGGEVAAGDIFYIAPGLDRWVV